MKKRLKYFAEQHTWKLCFLVTAGFFLIFLLITCSLYNSGDDAFFAYTLSGGYGEPGTNLLHYNYGWHYWLGSVIRQLFTWFPGINMYTAALVFFHFLACSSIGYVFFRRLQVGPAIFYFFTFFIFIEARQLLSLNYSGTAFITAASGASLFIYLLEEKFFKPAGFILGIALLILAGMLRLHISVVVMALFLPVVFTRLRKQALYYCITVFLVVAGSLLLLNELHEEHYKKNIPGWKDQENYRQALIYSYNRPIKKTIPAGLFRDSGEQELFFAGFLYDTSRFSLERVKKMSKNIVRKRLLNDKEDSQGLYWFFIETRIYLLLFSAVILSLLFQQKKREPGKWLWSLGLVLGTYSLLFIFLKINEHIHLGLLMILWLHLVMHMSRQNKLLPVDKKQAAILSVIFFALVIWMGVRLFKQDRVNRINHQRFLCAVKEINKYPKKLFVATYDVFPLNFISIWDSPLTFPANNLLYKDRLLARLHLNTLQKFGITHFSQALTSDSNLLLLGPPLQEISNLPKRVSINMGCLEIRKLQ
jgi:hypothetical protein